MSLSADTVAVLKACHPLLKEGREVVGAAFYRRLFEENPQVSCGEDVEVILDIFIPKSVYKQFTSK